MTKKEKAQLKSLQDLNVQLAEKIGQLGLQISQLRSEIDRGRENEQRARFEAARQRRRVEALLYHAILAHDHATVFERLRSVDTRDNVALAVAPEEERERSRS